MNYTIIISDGVFISKEPKPDRKDFELEYSHLHYELVDIEYEQALREFESNKIPVENAYVSEHPIEGYDEATITKPIWQIVEEGQQVTAEIKDGKATITKIN